MLPITFLAEGAPPTIDLTAALGYLWTGLVGGLISYVPWFGGMTTLPVTSVAVLVLLSPLVAAVLGAVVLGQTGKTSSCRTTRPFWSRARPAARAAPAPVDCSATAGVALEAWLCRSRARDHR